MTVSTHLQTKTIENFIDGKFCPSSTNQTFADINPANGETIAQVASGNSTDIDAAVSAAKHAFDKGPWSTWSIKQRAQVLRKIGDLILENKELLAKAETIDTGKPISESLNGDIPRAAYNFHFFADYANSLQEECYTVDKNERHIGVYEPLGVCGLITPWNLPLYLATWKIAPCLVMGNTCVLKPAEWTPYTAYLFAHIIKEAELPDGVFNIVQGFGPNSAGEALTRHADVASISFTGETSTGKAIMTAAASTLKKLSFELGGKGANIIFDDADLDEAIPVAVNAAFRNQGQICLAGSRLFVQEKVYNKVVEAILDKVKHIAVGDPLDPKTQMGAIISNEQLEKIQSYIEHGKKEGKLQIGGTRLKEYPKGNFLTPAVFTDLANSSRLCQEEIFGPVLPIVPFKDEAEVIEMTNSTKYGLSSSIWSQDINRCHRVSQAIKTGIVWINCWFARDLRTPFGGQKQSGIGREGGKHSLEFFSEQKTICYRYKNK